MYSVDAPVLVLPSSTSSRLARGLADRSIPIDAGIHPILDDDMPSLLTFNTPVTAGVTDM